MASTHTYLTSLVLILTVVADLSTAQIFQCSFEADTCGMNQDNTDNYDWVRTNLPTPTGETGPTRAQAGTYYLYMESSDPRRPGQKARVATTDLGSAYQGEACVSFYYHMYGVDMGDLKVYSQFGLDFLGSQQLLWERSGNQGNQWIEEKITVNIDRPGYRVAWEGTKGRYYLSDYGIDSIGITRGRCGGEGPSTPIPTATPGRPRLPWNCDFESADICQMTQSASDNFDWIRFSGPTGSTGTGPSSAQSGSFYVYTEVSGIQDGDIAILQTPQLDHNGEACMSFYYHMNGIAIGTLAVYSQSSGSDNPAFTVSGDRGNLWMLAEATVTLRNNDDRVMFMGSRSDDIQGDIAIDNLQIRAGSCSATPGAVTLPWSCSFETQDVCAMRQSTTDQFDWTRQTGPTPSSSTGPQSAQTGTWYLFTEVSGRSQGDTAIIESPPIQYTGEVCVDFYYHMSGSTIGSLMVYLASGDQNSPAFTISGDRGANWNQQRTTLTLVNTNDRVVFLGMAGRDVTGDISIDNINIRQGACGGGISLPWTCSFESPDLCQMRQGTSDNFDWSRNSGPTPSSGTGPSSAQSGSWYVYTEVSGQAQGDSAILESPVIQYSGDVCVAFYLHMTGNAVGTFLVYSTSSGRNNPAFTVAGDRGANWIRQEATVTLRNNNDRIMFLGTSGRDIQGDISLDNIDIRPGACSDGGGGTDGLLPWSCSFESADICEMTQSPSDNFDWTRQTGSTASADTGPTGAQSGSWYMYTEVSNETPGNIAIIETPALGYSRQACVEFYYHMHGRAMGTLYVYSASSGRTNPEFTVQGEQGTSWNRETVTVNLNNLSDKVVFAGTARNDVQGDISIDNINIRAGPCGGAVTTSTTTTIVTTSTTTTMTTAPPVPTPVDLPWSCDFENSAICEMVQSMADNFDWTRQSGGTPTAQSGPDRAQSGSWYMYTEISAGGRVEGEIAVLESPPIRYSGQACVRFYAHLYGSSMATLSVYTQRAGPERPSFTLSGNLGNNWLYQEADINLNNNNDKVMITGRVGNDVRGDIAIDNVVIQGGRCPNGGDATINLPWQCDFESSTICQMKQRTDDNFDWTRQTTSTGSSGTGPDAAQSGSYYMYTEVSGQSRGDVAILETPRINANGEVCVQFYYNMYGAAIGSLAVYSQSGGRTNPAFTISGDRGRSWISQDVTVTVLNFNDKILFMGTTGSDITGDVAIDNIRVRAGACGGAPILPWVCDFESSSICQMTQNADDNFDWTRQSGSTSSQNTGPTGAQSGIYYMYTEVSQRGQGDVAILDTPQLGYTGQVCVTFYYHMLGNAVGTLSVYSGSTGRTRPEFSVTGSQGGSWVRQEVTVSLGSNADKVMFLGSAGNDIEGDISIDNVNIRSGACGGSPTLPWRCDFETSDICQMTQSGSDNFDWTRQTGSTSSSGTGPTSAQSGTYYMYTEVSGRTRGDLATLETPQLNYNGQVCVSLNYHMLGNAIGTLAVYSASSGRSGAEFSLSGNRGANWVKQQVTVTLRSNIDKVLFTGTAGNDIEGDISIDNLEIVTGACAGEPGPDSVQLPWTCSFEQDTVCQASQRTDDNFSWTRLSGATPSSQTGPSSGQSGSWYMYIEVSGERQGNIAVFQTPQLQYDGAACVEFYYHMWGGSVGSLSVYTQSGDRNNPDFTLSGNRGNNWIRQTVTITLRNNNDRVLFLASAGNDIQGDIAIDNVSIRGGACSGTPGSISLPWSCSFEQSDICQMVQRSDDRFDWTRLTGLTPSSGTGPSSAQSGSYYMYTEVSGKGNGDDAILETPVIDASGDACVTFYYNMYGRDIATLSVYTQTGGSNNPQFSLRSNQGSGWLRAEFSISLLDNRDKVLFRGTAGSDIQGDIAIDNVNIQRGVCTETPDPGVSSTTTTTPSPGNERTLPYSCNFEFDFCGLNQRSSPTDDFDWIRFTGPTDTQSTGPTAANEGRYYIYAETSAPRQPGHRAYLDTPHLRYNGDVCVRLDFHMYGSDVGRLLIYTTSRGTDDPVFERFGDQGNEWRSLDAGVRLISGDQITFMAERGRDIRGDIAIDNFRVNQGRCSGSPPPIPPGPPVIDTPDVMTCNMEGDGSGNSQCRVRQESSDTFNWLRGTGRTPSAVFQDRRVDNERVPVTGPERAEQGNYYIYVEASGRRSGDTARLILEGDEFRRSGDNCLRFYFNMNGHHMGKLSVYVRRNNGQLEVPWHLIGDQLHDWHRAAVDINMDSLQQVGIEATLTSNDFSSDMAIDEITMSAGMCQSPPPGYMWGCNFEFNDDTATFCGMQQDRTDTANYDWLLWTKATPSDDTGPDLAYSGQYYLYLEASKPSQSGDRASILLPPQRRSGDMCLEFYYSMYGYHMGSLEVFVRQSGGDTNRWTLQGDQGPGWKSQRVTIEQMPFDGQVGFRGRRGTEFSSDIALDNIRIRAGRC